MHWICPLYKLSTCWAVLRCCGVAVLSSGVSKWPQQWLDMLSIPKISQRLMLSHGWESEVYSSPQNPKMVGCTSSKRTHWWGQKGKKKRRGKTRDWSRHRSSKGCYNNIVKELMIEDTAGYKNARKLYEWTMAIFGYAGHCACVGSTSWALLCKFTRLCWTTHGWQRNKGNVERKVWPVSNLSQQDSTPLNTSQQGVQMRSPCWAQHAESLYSG